MKFLVLSALAFAPSVNAKEAMSKLDSSRSTRLSLEAQAWDGTHCDVRKCTDWDCDEWCKCFNTYDENRGLYKSNKCDEDGEDECKCLVDFGDEDAEAPWKSRNPKKVCPEGTFKSLNTGLPALDGTGCQPYSFTKAACDKKKNHRFLPGTKVSDAKCTYFAPLKTCYAFRHQQWRMGAHKSCADYRKEEWTYYGKVTVQGRSVNTGCQTATTHGNTGWRNAYSPPIQGEYKKGLTMTANFRSWEDDSRRCDLNWWDDCSRDTSRTMHFRTSPNHNGRWQSTYWRSDWTEMKIETRTWRAKKC